MANQDVAASALTTKGAKLPLETQAATGFTHRFVIEAADINNASWTTDGDTVTVALGATPGQFIATRAMNHVTTAFATDGTLTMTTGIDGDTDAFTTSKSVKSAGILQNGVGAPVGTVTGTAAVASDEMVAVFATQGGSGAPADITAGRVEIYVTLIDLAELNDG